MEKRIILCMFFFTLLASLASAQVTHVAVGSVTPSVGSSDVDEAVILKSRYYHPEDAGKIESASLWIDVTQPLSKRTHSSVHAGVVKDGGTYSYYGIRYTGGTQQCGIDAEPRHCYKNYVWDVGGFAVGSNSWIYFNHDENLRDTTSATENTIGRYRAKSVTEIATNTLEVEWEIEFSVFFRDRLLQVYQSLIDDVGNILQTNDRPYWHEVGTWRVGNSAQTEIFSHGFETQSELNGWSIFGGANTLLSSEHSYRGGKSVRASQQSQFERDLGSSRQGVTSLFFFDDMDTSNGFYIAVSNKDRSRWEEQSTHTIAVGVVPSVSTGYYAYKGRLEYISTGGNIASGSDNLWQATPVKRTYGWHKVSFWVTETGAWATIDDVEQEIYPFSLNSIYPKPQSNGEIWLSSDWEMTDFRYIRMGSVSDTGQTWFDEVEVLNLPALPVPVSSLDTYEGALRWENYFKALWLDSYEEVVMFGNMQDWTQEHCTHYEGQPCKSWLWGELAGMVSAMYSRYKVTGLPYYKEKADEVYAFVLDNAYEGWNWADESATTHASTESQNLQQGVDTGWGVMPAELRAEVFTLMTRHLDYLMTHPNFVGFERKALIGDSSGEDYAWGPLYGAAMMGLYFSDHPHAGRWMDFGQEMAMKVFSTDADEPCEFCSGGVVGVKTIYAPGDNLQDCQYNTDPTLSQDCFCKGDRAQLPAAHDFSYLFDNHDYHPHPGYMGGSMAGALSFITQVNTMNRIRGTDIEVPEGFYHNLLPVWHRLTEFFDFRRGRYEDDKIYRIRRKEFCDGDDSSIYLTDRGPYDQDADNIFRTSGTDDWGILPDFTPNDWMIYKDVFGQSEVVFDNINMVDFTSKKWFWQHAHFLGQPVSVGLFFTDDTDLWCDWENPFCLLKQGKLWNWDRINPWYLSTITLARVEPDKIPPLKVCEENIFKKQVWSGGGISWACPADVKKEGSQSLSLTASQYTDAELYSPLIAVEPDSQYTVSYWVKTQNLVPSSAQVHGRIVAAQYNSEALESDAVNVNRIDAGFSSGENVEGTTGWAQKSYSFTTSQNTAYVRFRAPLGLSGTARGTVWFDDVQFAGSDAFDLDNDGDVDINDVLALAGHWGETSGGIGDLNKDNKVNIRDLVLLARNIGE